MQRYYDKFTITPNYIEYLHSNSPIYRGYSDSSRRKKPVSKGIRNFPSNRTRFSFALRRAKKRLRLAIASNVSNHAHCYFWTYTFATQPGNLEKNEVWCRSQFRVFMKKLQRQFNSKLKYVAIAELQKKNNRNAWHFHVLFFNLPFYPHSDMESLWSYGFVFVKDKSLFQSLYHIIFYMSKYLSKHTDVGRSKKLFWGSRNLSKPVVVYDKPVDLSNFRLYSDLSIETDKKPLYTLKTYYANHAISHTTTKINPHRVIYI